MAISFGIKSPLDYSVFSAASAALLFAAYEGRRKEWKWTGWSEGYSSRSVAILGAQLARKRKSRAIILRSDK